MARWIFSILLYVLLISCKNGNSNRLIPRKDLVPLLVDLHVSDALAVNTTISDQFGKLDSTLLYGTIMDKYGYTKDELLTTLNYYTNKPETLMEIYDEVFALLSAYSEEAKAEYHKYSSGGTSHLWRPEKNRFEIESDTAQYPVFDPIPIDSMGTYIINLTIKLNREDESVNPVCVAYFYKPEIDNPENRQYFKKIELNKSNYARELFLIHDLNDSSLTHLRIIPVSYENTDSSFNKSMVMYGITLSLLTSEVNEAVSR